MEIGIQLYTLRDYCKNLKDFSETLKKVADMGYRNIQVSGTCEYEGEWLRDELKKNGLRCVLTHNPENQLIHCTEELCKKHDIFDCSCIGLGCFSFGTENCGEKYRAFCDTYQKVAADIRSSGKYFMYHNHAQEFAKINGEFILEKIARDFAPENLGFTLDTFWVQAGGGDPAQWLERLSGRVPVIHLKDFLLDLNAKSPADNIAVMGEGNINFDRVFEKAESAGTKYMLVEQDTCHGEDPFACSERSYHYLHSCGF